MFLTFTRIHIPLLYPYRVRLVVTLIAMLLLHAKKSVNSWIWTRFHLIYAEFFLTSQANSMPNSGSAVVAEDLVKIFKEKSLHAVRALDGLSLNVRAGAVFGLLGPNGAGKTTLLRILTTLVRPTSGNVNVLGYDIRTHDLDIRRNICVVLQENSVELYLSVWDNLQTYGRFHSMAPKERRSRADRVIPTVRAGRCCQSETHRSQRRA